MAEKAIRAMFQFKNLLLKTFLEMLDGVNLSPIHAETTKRKEDLDSLYLSIMEADKNSPLDEQPRSSSVFMGGCIVVKKKKSTSLKQNKQRSGLKP